MDNRSPHASRAHPVHGYTARVRTAKRKKRANRLSCVGRTGNHTRLNLVQGPHAGADAELGRLTADPLPW